MNYLIRLGILLPFFLFNIQVFAACGPTYGADGIAIDRAGRVWMTHYEDNRIGRLDPSNGEFVEYLPDRKANPSVLARDNQDADEGFDYAYDFGLQGIGLDERHGYLWTVRFNTGTVIRFTLKDHTFTEFTLPGQIISARGSIPIDVDGGVWFVTAFATRSGYKNGKLVRVSPTGALQHYPLPEEKFAGQAMALDAEDHPWIVLNPLQQERDATVYALKDGRLVKQAVTGMGPVVASLAFDSQGSLWIAATRKNAVGRYIVGHEPVYYPIPTANAYPGGLVADAKGGVWFTEWFGHKLGHMSAGGALREFSLPPEEESPVTLAPDGQGRVWFSALLNYNLFQLDTSSGMVREYPVPVPANWSKDAAEGLNACVIKPRDIATGKSSDRNESRLSATTEQMVHNKPLRHPEGYPDDPGAKVFEQNCHTACHTWYRVDKAGNRRTDWAPTVDRMIDFNRAAIDQPQRDLIVDYLNRRYTMAQ